MKKHIFFIFFSLIIKLSFSQNQFEAEYFVRTRPISWGENLESITKDSVFSYFLNKLNINTSNYKIVSISDHLRYRDSLIVNKVSYSQTTVEFVYSDFNNIVCNTAVVYKEFISNSRRKKPTPRVNKLMFCVKDLSADDEKKYRVRFTYFR